MKKTIEAGHRMAMTPQRELIDNLQEWGEDFREKQHGATLTILRARKTILDQSARIYELEEVLNRLFHYTDCTTGQMAIIEERDDKIAEASDKLHQAFYTMKHDWKSGDFELPRLAEIHMAAIESKALELGKLLFRRQNSQAQARPALPDAECSNNQQT